MPKEETMKSGDDDALFCLTKHIDPNSTSSVINNIETSGYDYEDDRFYEKESKNEGTDLRIEGFNAIVYYLVRVLFFFFFFFCSLSLFLLISYDEGHLTAQFNGTLVISSSFQPSTLA